MKIDRQNIQGITFHEIQLGEHDDFSEVQLMRTGSFTHVFFGEMEITEEMFKSFRKNFRNDVKKIKLATDYSHFSHMEAAGWITDVILKEKNTELWIKVEWTPTGRQRIIDKEYKYMSADFSDNFQDNETGKKFGATLNGAALTNRPFIKDMDAVLSDIDMSEETRQAIREILNDEPIEKDINQMATDKEIKEHIAALSDEEKKAQGLIEVKEVEVQLSDDESKAKLAELEKENKKLTDDAKTSAKEAEFSKLLTDGKAVVAQKVAFMDGDMTLFAEQAVKLNTEVKGNGDDAADHDKDKDKDKPKTFDEAAEKAVDLVNVMLSENKGMKFEDAHKQVLSDNPELEKIMEAA